AFVMRAERAGSKTLLAQIVRLVGEAQRSRAPIQRLADQVSAYFVPAVVIVAILTSVGWAFLGPEPRLAHAVVNAAPVPANACAPGTRARDGGGGRDGSWGSGRGARPRR